jgi:hypothetical protein
MIKGLIKRTIKKKMRGKYKMRSAEQEMLRNGN